MKRSQSIKLISKKLRRVWYAFSENDFAVSITLLIITFVFVFCAQQEPVLIRLQSIGKRIVWWSQYGPLWHKFMISLVPSIIVFIIRFYGQKAYKKWFSEIDKNERMLKHFKHSFGIVKREMIPAMENLVDINEVEENQRMDKYIQSPIEYVNQTVRGNQVPTFKPDATYQDVLYDVLCEDENKKINYIVAITAENPNLFLDPTIGFYMSNCYAASLIRHINDFIKSNGSMSKFTVEDFKYREEIYKRERKEILKKLSEDDLMLEHDNFEFIRFFIFDKDQKECCDNAVFPSLKASQDLFRTHSYYIQKEKMQNDLGKQEWGRFKKINNLLWTYIDSNSIYENKVTAKTVLKKRKQKTIPEFLILVYNKKIEIHTYLGGNYCHVAIDDTDPNNMVNIKDLIKLLAKYAYNESNNCDLNIVKNLTNKEKTFIVWE